MENVKVGRKVAQTDIFVSFQRRSGHFYLLVGINMITHVVATFGKAVCDVFRKVAQTLPMQPRIKNGLDGLNYMSLLLTVANGWQRYLPEKIIFW